MGNRGAGFGARSSPRAAEVGAELLVHVDEAGGHFDAARHREAQPHCLPRAVVGVLPEDHHASLLEATGVERPEHHVRGGVDGRLRLRPLRPYELREA
eukprot:1188240-Prorocentrum_minimum.AAC.3